MVLICHGPTVRPATTLTHVTQEGYNGDYMDQETGTPNDKVTSLAHTAQVWLSPEPVLLPSRQPCPGEQLCLCQMEAGLWGAYNMVMGGKALPSVPQLPSRPPCSGGTVG